MPMEGCGMIHNPVVGWSKHPRLKCTAFEMGSVAMRGGCSSNSVISAPPLVEKVEV